MNYIPLTAAQKQILRDRTLLLARIMERYLEGSNTIEDVTRAFNLLIDVEPDLDVALTYAHDRERFASLMDDQRRTVSEDYRNLAYSPPDKIDKGAPGIEVRIRMTVERMPLNSDPQDKRVVDLYEPLTPEDKIASLAVDKRRDLYATPKQKGGTADWFDSAKQPEEWTPRFKQDPFEADPRSDRMRPRDTDLDMIRHAVCPSTFAKPAPEPTPAGPAKPPHLIPPRETDPEKVDPRQVRDDNWTFPSPTDPRRG